MKLLLHACCAPCTLEPLRLLLEEGHQISVSYNNSNIHPQEEYEKRLAVLLDFAKQEGLEVIEGPYDPQVWARRAGVFGTDPDTREQRCRECYRLRLEEAAAYAASHGFEGLSTTLDVSPYQYTFIIEEVLGEVCKPYGLTPVFRDFRPYYPEATRRSKAMGMYRQNYCGCAFSKVEAATERQERAEQRAALKAAKEAEMAPIRAAEAAKRAEEKAARKAYQDKRAAQRAALKAYKQAHPVDAQADRAAAQAQDKDE